MTALSLLFVAALAWVACSGPAPSPVVRSLVAVAITEPVPDDPDDPALWIAPVDPERSVIVGTNKAPRPRGSLVVFDLAGRILQSIGDLDRPNNIDIEQGVALGHETVDLAVVTERNTSSVRIYRIEPRTREFQEIGRARVFDGQRGRRAEPMGIGLYRRPDGATFVIVGRKSGPGEGYLWQYRLLPGPRLERVREFGIFSGAGEIEAIVVDDALGYVYYADEALGIRKYHADPDAPEADRELALFGRSGYSGDREGLALYAADDRTGFIVSTDQVRGRSRFLLYKREGTATDPHDHAELVAALEGPADATDGIEVTATSLSSGFPSGLLVAMNRGHRNFLLFPWPGPGGKTGVD